MHRHLFGTTVGKTRKQIVRLLFDDLRTQMEDKEILGLIWSDWTGETKLPPEELRKRVTSPNGTTQAAVERLDAAEVKPKIVAAIRRAAERSRELGKQG